MSNRIFVVSRVDFEEVEDNGDEYIAVSHGSWYSRREEVRRAPVGRVVCVFSTKEAAEKWVCEETKQYWNDHDPYDYVGNSDDMASMFGEAGKPYREMHVSFYSLGPDEKDMLLEHFVVKPYIIEEFEVEK